MAASRTILLISDASDLELDELSALLKREKLKTVVAKDADEGREYFDTKGLPHLVAIDLDLPHDQGVDLCQEFGSMAGMPTIVIADAGQKRMSAVEVLTYADDYVRREVYSAAELAARIIRILSRTNHSVYGGQRQIQIGESLQIDLVGRNVTTSQGSHLLTPTENALLSVLLVHRGQMVDGRTLVDRVWPFETGDFTFNALRVHMHRLRSKLEKDPDNPKFVLTERGIGYRFQA